MSKNNTTPQKCFWCRHCPSFFMLVGPSSLTHEALARLWSWGCTVSANWVWTVLCSIKNFGIIWIAAGCQSDSMQVVGWQEKQLVILKRYIELAPGHLSFRAEWRGTASEKGIVLHEDSRGASVGHQGESQNETFRRAETLIPNLRHRAERVRPWEIEQVEIGQEAGQSQEILWVGDNWTEIRTAGLGRTELAYSYFFFYPVSIPKGFELVEWRKTKKKTNQQENTEAGRNNRMKSKKRVGKNGQVVLTWPWEVMGPWEKRIKKYLDTVAKEERQKPADMKKKREESTAYNYYGSTAPLALAKVTELEMLLKVIWMTPLLFQMRRWRYGGRWLGELVSCTLYHALPPKEQCGTHRAEGSTLEGSCPGVPQDLFFPTVGF